MRHIRVLIPEWWRILLKDDTVRLDDRFFSRNWHFPLSEADNYIYEVTQFFSAHDKPFLVFGQRTM